MSWQKIVIENRMDLRTALDIFEVSDISKISNLKQAFNKLAKKHHPDLGGSNIKMIQINAAYEFLKKTNFSTTSGGKTREEERRERDEKWEKAFLMTKYIVDSQFEINNFIKHFEEIFNETFAIKNLQKTEAGGYNQSYSIEFEIGNKSNEISFFLRVYTSTCGLYDKILLPGDVGDLSITTTTEILFNRRKMKLSHSDWKMRTQRGLLSNPEILFPKDKILKKTKTVKKGKFSKKDFELSLKRLFKPVKVDDIWFFPTKVDDVFFRLDRYVMMRRGRWSLMGFARKHSVTYRMIDDATLKSPRHVLETEQSLDFVIDIIKDIQKANNPLTIINEIERKLRIFHQSS